MGIDPVSLAIGAAVIGGGLGAAGSIKSGNASYAQAQYQAQVSERNKQIADQNAVQAIGDGKIQEQQVRREAAQTASTQRAVLAGLGQEVGVGSAGQIVGDTAQLAEADALTVRRNAERQALGFTLQGIDDQSDAAMQRAAGSSARTSGFLKAGASLVSTVGSAASMQAKFKGGPSAYSPPV